MDKAEQNTLFRELFEVYRQPLFAYLYRLVGDLGSAEDVVQDVFLRAYEALPRLAPDANRRAWLYRIATNAARDLFRRRKVRHSFFQWLPFSHGEDPEDADARDVPADLAQPDLPADERLAVHQALQSLDATYRVPLILFSVEGLSTREIAEVLGIGQSAVKMRLSRARTMFQSAYGAD
jgi:RNA polymerase sigma-70 factor (ECF subfamily)